MADLNNFNANDHEPNDFSPVPAGRYLAAITASEMKPTKAGNGSYLELEFEILEGEYKGRKLWDRLNLDNPNETAVKIAQGTLSAICRAVGVMQPRDSAELHGLPLTVIVAVEKRQDNGEDSNRIKGYKSKNEPAETPAAPATKNGAPPWKKTK